MLSQSAVGGCSDDANPADVTVATVDSYQVRASAGLMSAACACPACGMPRPACPAVGENGACHLAQGLEKPIIVLSTAVTRAGAFVADPHRLNVALTRARNHLILVRMRTVANAHACRV